MNEYVVVAVGVVVGVLLFLMLTHKPCDYEKFSQELDDIRNITGIENIVTVPQDNPKNGSLMTGYDFQMPLFLEDLPPITVVPPNSYLLDDGNSGNSGMMTNLCSKACCSAQYPLPFNMKYENIVCANSEEFVPNNLTCNNAWQDSGCLCLTKKQAQFMYNRGGNA